MLKKMIVCAIALCIAAATFIGATVQYHPEMPASMCDLEYDWNEL